MHTLIPMNIADTMAGLTAAMAVWQDRTKRMEESHHTCNQQMYKYPWPPDPECSGCRALVKKYAKMFHLELPLLVLGFDAVAEEIDQQFELKMEQARVNRSLGSGI
jgi:hypothetical protein